VEKEPLANLKVAEKEFPKRYKETNTGWDTDTLKMLVKR